MATELVKPTSTATKPAVKADRLRSLKKRIGELCPPWHRTFDNSRLAAMARLLQTRRRTARCPDKLPSHDRFDYSPITRRPDYRWPNGAGLAVYLGFNIEHFAFGEGLGANIGPASAHPDVLN